MTVSSAVYTDAPGSEGQSHVVTAIIDGETFSNVDLRVATFWSEQVHAWIAAGNTPAPYTPSPPAPVVLSYGQFRMLFTAAENRAIMTAATNSHDILDWLLQAVGANSVSLADPQVSAGLDALVAAGLISSDRVGQVLAGQAPAAN